MRALCLQKSSSLLFQIPDDKYQKTKVATSKQRVKLANHFPSIF